jgi:hypothetical protein
MPRHMPCISPNVSSNSPFAKVVFLTMLSTCISLLIRIISLMVLYSSSRTSSMAASYNSVYLGLSSQTSYVRLSTNTVGLTMSTVTLCAVIDRRTLRLVRDFPRKSVQC